jgi:hypothetical protein
VDLWQGLENARPARPAGASVIDQLAKKSSFLLLATLAVVLVRNIKAWMSFEATTEVIKVQQRIIVIGKRTTRNQRYRIRIGDTIENEDSI